MDNDVIENGRSIFVWLEKYDRRAVFRAETKDEQ